MTEDPVLDAHHVSDRFFELGGCFSPASVRDQMLRAYAFVTRAVQAGLIAGKEKPLLVIGGGSTGMTAALAAADLGVKTWVVERREGLVFRLSECPTRDVDPTLYDWPADHWRAGAFPIAGAEMPLRWDYGTADVVASQWRRVLASRDAGPDANPKIINEACPVFEPEDVPPSPDKDGLTRVTVRKDDGTTHQFACGAVVSCVGWHEEITWIKGSTFKGFPFWDEDPLQQPMATACSRAPNVLIAGGGDGALQDLIRIATNLSARGVLERLLGLGDQVEEELERCRNDLKHPEDVAQRALVWGLDQRHDDPVLERLEKSHEDAVASLEASPAWDAIRDEIEDMLVEPFPSITLAHSRLAFTQGYALNRFLTLLILKVAGDRITRLRKTRVDAIAAHDKHHCTGVPNDCHLKPHAVSLKEGDTVQDPQVFEVVVLRLGLDADRSLFKDVPARVRHLLPYFIEEHREEARPASKPARKRRSAKVAS